MFSGLSNPPRRFWYKASGIFSPINPFVTPGKSSKWVVYNDDTFSFITYNRIGNILEKLEMTKLNFSSKKYQIIIQVIKVFYFKKCFQTIDQGCIFDSFTVKMWELWFPLLPKCFQSCSTMNFLYLSKEARPFDQKGDCLHCWMCYINWSKYHRTRIWVRSHK